MKRILKFLSFGSVCLLGAMASPYAERFVAATGPDSVKANVELRGKSLTPVVQLQWVDTSNALVMTEVLRRSTGSDTAWKKIGVVWLDDSTKVGLTTLTERRRFADLYPSRGKSYGYRLQDSIRASGTRLVMPSDSIHVVVP